MIGSFIVLFLFGPYFFVVHLSLKNTSTFTHHGQPPPSPPILLRHHHPPSSLSSVIDDGTKRRFSASNSNDFHKGESQSADRPREEILLVSKGCLIALLVDEEEDLVPEACDPKQGND